ncbi:hypothetical protein ACNKHO_24905 [Shigella flexneri]
MARGAHQMQQLRADPDLHYWSLDNEEAAGKAESCGDAAPT